MSKLTAERFELMKLGFAQTLYHKQLSGDTDKEILLWLDGLHEKWGEEIMVQNYIDDLQFSITEAQYIIDKVKEFK
jgi:hypothetical protein